MNPERELNRAVLSKHRHEEKRLLERVNDEATQLEELPEGEERRRLTGTLRARFG